MKNDFNQLIRVKFEKWEVYQSRNDIKKPSWFKLQNDLFENQKLYKLNLQEIACFVFLLCIASKQNKNGYLELNLDYAFSIVRKEKKVLLRTIEKLIELQVLKQYPYAIRTQSVQIRTQSVRQRREEENREEENRKNYIVDFDEKKTNNPVNLSDDNLTPDSLVKIWNENSGTLPKVKALSDKRRRLCKVRINECPDANYWVDVVKKISQSNFCNGQSKAGWIASFDWILQADVHLKVSEGRYDNKSNGQLDVANKKFDWESFLAKG